MPLGKNKISYTLDLSKELAKIKNASKRTAFKREIAEMILSEIKMQTLSSTSPVTGDVFKALSKKYADKKRKITGSSDPDLHLNDNMINSMKTEIKDESIIFKITDPTEKKKAYNHNVGDTLPRRPFLPDDEKKTGKYAKFNSDILNLIKEKLRDVQNNG